MCIGLYAPLKTINTEFSQYLLTVWENCNDDAIGTLGGKTLLYAYAVITIAIRLRYDYDPTTTYRASLLPIRRKQKMNISIFGRSRIVVESQV